MPFLPRRTKASAAAIRRSSRQPRGFKLNASLGLTSGRGLTVARDSASYRKGRTILIRDRKAT